MQCIDGRLTGFYTKLPLQSLWKSAIYIAIGNALCYKNMIFTQSKYNDSWLLISEGHFGCARDLVQPSVGGL